MDLTADVEALLGLGILLSALYLQSESFVDPLVGAISLQSLLVAGLLGYLAWADRDPALAAIAALVVVFRVLVIPLVLRQQIRAFRWRSRELRASQRVASHALAAVSLTIVGWLIFQQTLAPSLPTPPGAPFPFLLLLQGLLVLSTRENTLVRVMGYVEAENAIVYAGALFAAGFPVFLEAVIFLDVFGVVLVSVILSIQRSVIGVPDEAHPEELSG
jgi:hydrogenase-4 component E